MLQTIQLLKEKGFNFSPAGELDEFGTTICCDSETRLLCQLKSINYFFEIEL